MNNTPQNYFRLNRLTEEDIDQIVFNAGGKRAVSDHCLETELNADYLLDDAIVELKLIEEEGLEKETRRRKVADIFGKTQVDRPVVVIDPNLLCKKDLQKYQNAMEGPIKTQVKKAAKQLYSTWGKNNSRLRVLLAINNGYSALDADEFNSIVVKCATNDTAKIDYVITAGFYYYSDDHENYFFPTFELFQIQTDVEFHSFTKLKDCWHRYTEKLLTLMLLDEREIKNPKNPVIDIEYLYQGIKYLKPAPPMGKPSEFYTDGVRPRYNSTGIERLPPIGIAFPQLSKDQWCKFKMHLPHENLLQGEYSKWRKFVSEEMKKNDEKLMPAVGIDIVFEQFEKWCDSTAREMSFSNLCYFSRYLFDAQVRKVIHCSNPADNIKINYTCYIYLSTEELGRDKANDISSIYYVSEIPGLERQEELLKDQLLFFEFGLAIASAYAIKYGTSLVIHEIDKTYCWN